MAGELDGALNRAGMQICIVVITETKNKGTEETNNFTIIYSGVPMKDIAKAGMMLYIHRTLARQIVIYHC